MEETYYYIKVVLPQAYEILGLHTIYLQDMKDLSDPLVWLSIRMDDLSRMSDAKFYKDKEEAESVFANEARILLEQFKGSVGSLEKITKEELFKTLLKGN